VVIFCRVPFDALVDYRRGGFDPYPILVYLTEQFLPFPSFAIPVAPCRAFRRIRDDMNWRFDGQSRIGGSNAAFVGVIRIKTPFYVANAINKVLLLAAISLGAASGRTFRYNKTAKLELFGTQPLGSRTMVSGVMGALPSSPIVPLLADPARRQNTLASATLKTGAVSWTRENNVMHE
jgi:hypothetical protein